MLNITSNQPQGLNQAQIYQDLSEIIKIFKSFLSLLDKIASNIHKMQDSDQAIQQLKQSLKNSQGFIKFYNFRIQNQSQHKNIFHRFICRIMEVFSAYKLRFQAVPYSEMLKTSIKQIQKSVLSYQSEKNIGQIFRKIQISLIKFYSSKEKKKNVPEDKNYLYQKSYNYQIGKFNENKNQFQILNLTIHHPLQKTKASTKSDTQLNRLILQLNKKYKVLNSLDLDYNYFKQSFFQSRDQKEEFYGEYFERNQQIYNQIMIYSTQFHQYLKRRQLKKSFFRKNKFLQPNSNIRKQYQKQSFLNFTKKKVSLDSRQSFYKQNLCPLPQKKNPPKNLSQSPTKNLSQIVYNKDNKQIDNQQYLTKEMKEQSEFGKIQQRNQFIKKIVFTDTFDNFQIQNQIELSKRKKNLQLKKVDISLSTYCTQAQSAKLNHSKFGDKNQIQFKKVNLFQKQTKIRQISQKQLRQQKKYIQSNQQKEQNLQDLEYCMKSPITPHKRKYLIKTSSKKSSIQDNNNKKQNGLINIKNFRRLKVQQIQKLQSLGKQLCAVRSIKIPLKQS